MTRSTAPHIYRAIAAITRSFAKQGIAKSQRNDVEGYAFRGIDDIYNRLSPLLVRHKLCLLPRVLERGSRGYRSQNGEMIFATWVKAAFELRSAVDGSGHTVETYGEAMDQSDKGTSKALSAAYKYAILQAFCIPVGPQEDADRTTPPKLERQLPPEEGWQRWIVDLRITAASCMSDDALDLLQSRHRDRLRVLSRAEPELYAALGMAIRDRRELLRAPSEQEAA